MPVVGDASVIVRAITDRVKSDIEKAFKDARPAIQAAGKDHGQAYGDSFKNSLKNSMSGSGGIDSVLNDPKNVESARKAGHNIGQAMSEGINDEVGSFDFGGLGRRTGRDFGDELIDGTEDAIETGGRRLESPLRRALANAGRGAGNTFRSILDGEIGDSAISASASFTRVFAAGNILGVGIAGLVSGISTLVSGLYTMASAASVAAGALVVLPGAISVAAQAVGTLKLAFSGVGEALKAGMKQATAATNQAGKSAVDNSAAIAAAQRAIQDANKGVADAYDRVSDAQEGVRRARDDAARAAEDASRRVADAERDVADAQRELLSIQKELNAARAEAAESLQQLGFDAEGAALAEERASLRLESAYEKLKEVQDLPADDRTRKEAELSYKEAELAFREAKDRNADLAKEQKKAAKAGIEGSEEVLSVRERINSAQETLADRERALADARRNQARQQIDSAQAIADAEDRVRDARDGVQDALQRVADAERRLEEARRSGADSAAGASAATQAYDQAMQNLSPAAREFVTYLISIKDAFDGVKAAAGAEFFPKLEEAIQRILDSDFRTVIARNFRATGSILGDFANQVSETITSVEGLRRIDNIMGGNNEILRVFSTEGENGKTAIQNLVIVVLRLLEAIQPLTKRFAEWVATLSESAEAATRGADGMDRMTGSFEKAGDRAALLGDIFGNIFGVFRGLGAAGDKAGEGLLESLNEYLAGLNEFVNSDDGREKLEKYFDRVADNMRAIGRLTRAIGRAFGGLGDNPGVADFADSMVPAIDNLGKIGDNLTAAGGSLGEFATELSEIALALADTKGIEIFFDVINGILGVITDLLGTSVGKWLVGAIGAAAAFTRALSFMLGVGKTVFKILLGGPIKLRRQLIGLFGGGQTAAKGLDKVSGASARLEGALKKQMTIDQQKITKLKQVEIQANRTAAALGKASAGAVATGAGAAAAGGAGAAAAGGAGASQASRSAAAKLPAAAVGPVKTTHVVPPATTSKLSKVGKAAKVATKPVGLLAKGFGALSLALLGVSAPVALIIAAIGLLIYGLVKLYKNSPAFKEFVDNIVDKLKKLGEWFTGIMKDHVLPFLDGFFEKVNEYLPKIGEIFGDVFGTIWGVATWLFGFFKKNWPLLVGILLGPMGFIVAMIIKHWGKIKGAAQSLWQKVKDAVNKIKHWFQVFKDGGKALKDYIVGKVVDFMKKRWEKFNENIGRIVGWIRDKFNKFQAAGKALKEFFQNRINDMKEKWEDLREKIADIIEKVRNRFEVFKTALGGVKDLVFRKIKDIKEKFHEIKDAVAAAFGGLKKAAGGKLQDFIDFLNNKLIKNINKVTSKFGLEIGTIPATGYAQGGWTGPGPKNRVAGVVHSDEHVIKKSSRRSIEAAAPGILDYMNRTGKIPRGTGGIDLWPGDAPDIGVGKLKDIAKDTVGNVKNLGKKIAKDGLGKVLETLVDGATGLMGAAGIKRGMFLNDFFYAIMDKLASYAKKWGGDEGEQPGGKIPYGGTKSKYTGPPGGWTNPVRGTYVITQWPNSGHNPWNSIDFGAAGGTPVVAASRGRVTWAGSIAGSYGSYVKVAHAGGLTSLYAHLSSILAKVGQQVSTGQVIGRVGTTGNSTGNHLHFEVQPLDPAAWLRRKGVRLAKGGVVQATPGGILANIGEAGRNERVEPLAPDGFSTRDRAIIQLIESTIAAGSGRQGDSYHVYPAPGMDEEALAMMVSRRVAWRRSVGT